MNKLDGRNRENAGRPNLSALSPCSKFLGIYFRNWDFVVSDLMPQLRFSESGEAQLIHTTSLVCDKKGFALKSFNTESASGSMRRYQEQNIVEVLPGEEIFNYYGCPCTGKKRVPPEIGSKCVARRTLYVLSMKQRP